MVVRLPGLWTTHFPRVLWTRSCKGAAPGDEARKLGAGGVNKNNESRRIFHEVRYILVETKKKHSGKKNTCFFCLILSCFSCLNMFVCQFMIWFCLEMLRSCKFACGKQRGSRPRFLRRTSVWALRWRKRAANSLWFSYVSPRFCKKLWGYRYYEDWVVSNILNFHPYLGTNILQLSWNHQLDLLHFLHRQIDGSPTLIKNFTPEN